MRIDTDGPKVSIHISDPSKIEGCQLSAITHFLQKCLDYEKAVYISSHAGDGDIGEIVFEVRE